MPRAQKSHKKREASSPTPKGRSSRASKSKEKVESSSQAKDESSSSKSHSKKKRGESSSSEKKADPPAPRDPDEEPFDVGAAIVVLWPKDGSARLCAIVEKAPREVEGWRYYVHYHDFNRRMDEWVTIDRILERPSAAAKEAAARKGAGGHGHGGGGGHRAGHGRGGGRPSSSHKLPAIDEHKEEQQQEEQQEEEEEEEEENVELVVAGYEGQGTQGSGALDFGGGGSTTTTRKTTTTTSRQKRKRPRSSETSSSSQAPTTAGGGGVLSADEERVTAVEDMEHDEHEGLDEASLREHEEVTKVKNVGRVELGRHTIETWYFSPFPKEYYPSGYAETLYVCEHTFSFFKRRRELARWRARRAAHRERQSPPGDEIYRSEGLAMFEVDGNEHTVFCQNLCYFAKLFLDHKTLYFDVDPFLFYVLCEYDDFGYHPVGYYSKEKSSEVGYNLACILTFPPYQRKGYGRFLIAFSYALSKKEGKVGAPEKPLSDLGHVSYRSYWSSTLVHHLRDLVNDGAVEANGLLLPPSEASNNARFGAATLAAKGPAGDAPAPVRAVSVMDLSKATSIMADDVIATLQYLGLIRCVNGTYVLWASKDVLDKLAERYPVKLPTVNVDALHWTPFASAKRDKFSIKAKKAAPDSDS